MPDFAVVTAFSATDRISPVFNRMGGAAERFGNRTGNAFEKASKGGFGMLSAAKGLLPLLTAGGILEFANKSVEAFRETQAAQANVIQGLKSTQFAAGLTFDDLQDMSDRLMKNSVFGDETILQNATAQLLTFTSITSANFERVQSAAADVASKLYGIKVSGEQLHSVSIMMGKMMENPVKGLTAARRIGISFSAAQEQMVKSMVATNDTIGAQNYMLKIIEKQYGGTAKALSLTDEGQALQRQARIHGMMADLGRVLSPMKKTGAMFIEEILPTIITLVDTLGGIFKTITPAVKGFGDALSFIKPIIPYLVYGFLAWKVAIWGVTAAKAAMLGLSWIAYLWMMRAVIWGAITRTVLWTKAQWLLNAAMSANPIGLVIIGIAALIALVALIIIYWDNWGKVIVKYMGPLGALISIFKEIYDRWGELETLITNGNMEDFFLRLGGIILSKMLIPLQTLMELMAYAPVIGDWANYFANRIKDAREAVNPHNPEAPNRKEAEARQKSQWEGTLNFANPPSGMTFSQQGWNAPPIQVNGLGGGQ